MELTSADQYGISCVVAEDGDTAQQVIDFCWEAGATRQIDGIEYCVQLRPEVGPELWTERALRRSLPIRWEG